MIENIIWILTVWACGGLFLGIGIYAGKRKNPMWFWAGTTVDPKTISNIPAYNRANRKMWAIYSIPFFVTGISYIWFPIASVVLMGLASTVGLLILILSYLKIEKKYKIK